MFIVDQLYGIFLLENKGKEKLEMGIWSLVRKIIGAIFNEEKQSFRGKPDCQGISETSDKESVS